VLAGGGDMGALARAVDWSATPVGAIETWPQSLRTAISILLEAKFPMLLCWGPDFIQFYNDAFRPILGVNKHPAFGKRAPDTFQEAWHIVGPLFDQVMQGEAVGFEDMLVPLDRNGFLEECYFHYSYSPVRGETGSVDGLLVTCMETTGRVIAERRLRTLRELATQAAQAQDEASAWQGAARVLKSSAADLPFSILYELDATGQQARVVSNSAVALAPRVIHAGNASAWPLFEVAADGAPRLVQGIRRRFGDHAGSQWPEPIDEVMVLPVSRAGTSQPYGFLVAGISPRLALDDYYRDFLTLVADQIATALGHARAYDEERRRTQALIELDRQKTAFFSNVSHEFRTPLTLMLAPLEESLARPSRTMAAQDVELVYRNATRLLRLVNTLLDFSRIEAGRANINLEPTDLAALTRELASTFQSLMEQAGLLYEVECPPLSAPVMVDRDAWEKIVLNLIANAYKFTLQGSVRVGLREVAGGIQLMVQDTGAGIPAAEQSRIFERFHRVPGTPARTFEGSGIGLSLVRELARMHDGTVYVHSEQGRGSIFRVTLPPRIPSSSSPRKVGASAASRLYLEDASRWSSDAGGPSRSASVMEPVDASVRVLIVDDSADMRDYLVRLFSGHWSVDAAANGREALKRIASAPPDLVVTDVMMPEMNGVELLQTMRANPETQSTPVIMLSARSGEEARIEGLEAGADDYVIKPFSSRELVARVRTQLELVRLRRQLATR
jgi:signal transduction histidine kinase/CheY-like chemotaxis protein